MMIKSVLLFSLSLISFSVPSGDKVFQFRGSNRDGIYKESNLLREWPAEGPREIFSIDNIGEGFVSPVFTEKNFFITGETDSKVTLYCFNLKGEKIWETLLGTEWMKTYPGARTAPTIVGDLIYVGSGMGNLYCVRRGDGKILWSKDLVTDLKGVLPMHGHSEAPLIDGDKIFWTTGGPVNNVVALNRYNGNLIWANKGFGETSAYNPPRLIELATRHILVTFSAYHLMGFDTNTGKLLWSHEQDNYPVEEHGPGVGDTHSNTVVYDKGSIYYAAGDGNGGVKLNLSEDGTKITEVWRNKGFDSYMGGVIKIGDWLYCGATEKPELKALNATSGVISDSLRIGSGALIAADSRLYYYTQKGDMFLIRYDEGKLSQVSSFRIKKGTNQHFSHPVINKGILYQRHGNVLMAFDIKGNR